MGRITYGKWPHPASAYITGISVGILLRSPFLWPYFLCSLISITSKYVLALPRPPPLEPVQLRRQRAAVPRAGDGLAAQHPVGQRGGADGGHLALGSVIVWRVGALHISATYVASFLLFSFVRARRSPARRGWPTVAPITGPMYQLFIFFMVTDPKMTVRAEVGQCLVVFIVAFVEMMLRLNEVVYAPFYALFIVGPIALLIDIWLEHWPPVSPLISLRLARPAVRHAERSVVARAQLQPVRSRSSSSRLMRPSAKLCALIRRLMELPDVGQAGWSSL